RETRDAREGRETPESEPRRGGGDGKKRRRIGADQGNGSGVLGLGATGSSRWTGGGGAGGVGAGRPRMRATCSAVCSGLSSRRMVSAAVLGSAIVSGRR